MWQKFFLSGNFKGYNLAAFQKDLLAGVVVGVIAIPLGMAFAIASEVKPEYGIYTTIIAGIIISLLEGLNIKSGPYWRIHPHIIWNCHGLPGIRIKLHSRFSICSKAKGSL